MNDVLFWVAVAAGGLICVWLLVVLCYFIHLLLTLDDPHEP